LSHTENKIQLSRLSILYLSAGIFEGQQNWAPMGSSLSTGI